MTARWENIPEQFLGYGSVNKFPRHGIRKQQPKYCWMITMETPFSLWFVPEYYKQCQSCSGRDIPFGGGFEYLHRSPASRRRRRKGNPVPGGVTGPPCSWGILIRGPNPPGWGGLESEAVKYGRESPRMTALGRTRSNCKLQTHPLWREDVT
jgi:hypothetical protein